MAESVKQICLIAHIITGKNVPKYLKQSKFNALLKKKDKKSPTRMAGHVGEWASLRNTSPEIAEAIFEVAGYDEKMAEKIWEEGSDEVLVKAFAKTDKDSP